MTATAAKRARILASANQKGGVGKTTTAINLAASLVALGKTVLVVDLDPHAGASVHLRFYPETLAHTVHDLFRDDLDHRAAWAACRKPEPSGGFDFVPAHHRLAELEADLLNRKNKGFILRDRLTHIAGEYDEIILDCPPHVGVLLVNALTAADFVVIPVQTEFLALNGLKLLFDTMRTLNRVRETPLAYKALAVMFDERTGACRRVLGLLRDKLGERLCTTVIRIDTKFREASALGKVLLSVSPRSRGALEYRRLAEELLQS